MMKRFFASVAALATSAGLAVAQPPAGTPLNDPMAMPIPGVAPPGSAMMPVVGSEALFLQGGQYDAWAGYGPHRTCDECGRQCGQNPWCPKCADGANQKHKAAGGPDCFYFDIELLYLYFRSMPVTPSLITAGPIGTTGRLGEDGVQTLFGNENVQHGPHASLRLTMGIWDACRKWGIEASGFLTEQRAEVDQFDAPINGRVVLARPNFNVLTGVPDSVLISSPPVFGGSAGIYTNTRAGGAEANILRAWCYYDRFKFNTLAGARWFSLNEQIRIDSTSVLPFPDPNDPQIVDIVDNFTTRNNFYGANFGFQTEWRHGRWYTDMTAKIGVGFTHEKVNIHGSTSQTVTGITNTIPFGAYALEPNSGDFTENKFSVLPEFTLKVGYNWTQRMSTYIGYNGLYLSRVVRPGNQINPNVNPTLLPVSNVYNPQFPFGPAQPALIFDNNDFYLQGVTFGMSIRY